MTDRPGDTIGEGELLHREFLLLASYCGNDNDECTEQRPCPDCLDMCNVFDEAGNYLRELGAHHLPGRGYDRQVTLGRRPRKQRGT
jgi:hypothetical protein